MHPALMRPALIRLLLRPGTTRSPAAWRVLRLVALVLLGVALFTGAAVTAGSNPAWAAPTPGPVPTTGVPDPGVRPSLNPAPSRPNTTPSPIGPPPSTTPSPTTPSTPAPSNGPTPPGGVPAEAAATAIYAHANGWNTVVPTLAWAGGLAAALLIGALAGLLPALRAARMSPTQALWTV